MLPDTDDAAIQADAYIDALLTGHARTPVPLDAPLAEAGMNRDMNRTRAAIELLERGLPRFHPSFLFEEWLAEQLRRAGTRDAASSDAAEAARGEVISIGLERPPAGPTRLGDRRLWVGGAIASGVSICGAAVYAWRRRRD